MKRWRYIPLTLLALLVWWPVWYLLMGALQSPEELALTVGPAISGKGEAIYTVLPVWPTLWPLVELLLDTPEFWDTFWNTVLLSVPQVLGQLLTGVPAAWALSRLRFRGKTVLTWVEFGDFTEGTTRKKTPGRLVLRLEMDEGVELDILIRYDSRGDWLKLRSYKGQMVKDQVEVIIPLRRCDHYRVRIEGTCQGGSGWTFHDLTRERSTGSNRK